MKLTLLVVSMLSCIYVTAAINHGLAANTKNFKYIVSIVYEKEKTGICKLWPTKPSGCTGGIIHEKFVLTAAHCFATKGNQNPAGGYYRTYQKGSVTVYAHTNNWKQQSVHAIKRSAKKIHFVSEYFQSGRDDIAIVELHESLYKGNDGSNLLTLSLPEKPEHYEFNNVNGYSYYGGVECSVAGYGKDLKRGQDDGSLKYMTAQILSKKDCSAADKFMCATAIAENGDKPEHPLGSCFGDSGAPVVMLGATTVIGVVATGANEKCDGREVHDPETYMRVSYYIDFINQITTGRGSSSLYIAHDTSQVAGHPNRV